MAAITSILSMVLFSIIFVAVLLLLFGFYLMKVKKIGVAEEIVKDDSFRRADAVDYAKFKDVVSFSEKTSKAAMGMIAVDERTFVGGIDIYGYDFANASVEERENTMINTIAFFNVLEEPVQLRQSVQPVNISYNIEKEKDRAKEIEKSIIEMEGDFDHIFALMEESADDPERFAELQINLEAKLKSIKSKRWILRESQEMIHYMDYISNVNSHPKKVHQMIFSYTYSPDEVEGELTQEGIYLRAQRELEAKAEIYGKMLSNTGCTWKALSADDLTSVMRRHYHPITADAIRLEELMNSSYTALYITSDSLRELEIERRGEFAHAQEMKALEEKRVSALAAARARFEAERQARIEEAEAVESA